MYLVWSPTCQPVGLLGRNQVIGRVRLQRDHLARKTFLHLRWLPILIEWRGFQSFPIGSIELYRSFDFFDEPG